ncbi:MAG: DUF5615 family PIN-like protein [Thermodesulfobacteriota bacterium]|nr:DUF5615 family PIN-like protein [Thermodesulfobacteriota bacterium]
MNLPPRWTEMFDAEGWEAVHWSGVGDFDASDRTIMEWARERGYVVFTHDLDFGALLAATQRDGPSVIQVRTQGVLPETLGEQVVKAIRRFQGELERGALIRLGKPPALPGDSQSLTIPGVCFFPLALVGNLGQRKETFYSSSNEIYDPVMPDLIRHPVSAWIPAFAGMTTLG